jgi:hypothetical protein
VFSLATQAAPGRPNEDFALASTDLVVVIDGDGAPDGDCHHGVPWFSRQLGTQTMAALVDDPEMPLAEGLARGIRAVGRLHVYTCDLASRRTPSAAVGILRIGPDAVDTLSLGGCVVVVDAGDGPQLTRDLTGSENAAAEPRAARLALTNSYPREKVRRVAVLSDGAAAPADRDGGYAWPDYLDLLDTLGPIGLLSRLQTRGELGDAGAGVPPDDATVVHAPPLLP